MCNGQFLPINENQALFSLLGTTFGGNGQTTFALPDLRGRVAIHEGAGFTLGQRGGQEFHTLTQSEMPQHVHVMRGNTADGDAPIPDSTRTFGAFLNGYTDATNLVALSPSTVSNVGGSQPHENRQPFTVLTYIIALQGIFPSPN
jgi:microcystin-dependent protein